MTPKDKAVYAKEPIKLGPFLSPKEFAYVTSVGTSKLEHDRKKGSGPVHFKIGGRVLYLEPSAFGPLAN